MIPMTLRPAPGGGTELTLVHERLEELRVAMPTVADNVGPGWEDVLDKLAAALTAPASSALGG